MPADSRYIDIHCHHIKPDSGVQLRSLDLSQITANPDLLTCQADLQHMLSIGIHPWYIEPETIAQSLQNMQSLFNDRIIVAVGECGLDKSISTDLTLQIQVFRYQAELAERLEKPLIVHCVRAFNELLQLYKQLRPTQPWLVHGFSGKAELAGQLAKHGVYLCFGKALLNERSPASHALQAVPLEQLFLETDDSAYEISEIYAAAAKILGLDLTILQRQIVANFERVFAHD
ncbi:MAG: deoxyribonuclease [Methylomonas sp.]|nr:MAG: deoxyribonuclease [Methylomonas sp.]